jgi:hypothetical protein
LKALRDQLGYKLPVLLASRARDQDLASDGVTLREVLVGDDAEADAFVYSLYGDVASGVVDGAMLERILRAGDVYPDQRKSCLDSLAVIRTGETVERILIHLDRQSPPSHFHAYGPRVVPFYNYLQAAFVLAEDARLDGRAVLEVAGILATRHRFDGEALGRSYKDLLRRGHARGTIAPLLERGLVERAPDAARPALEEMTRLIAGYLGESPEGPPIPAASPDYVELADRHRGGRNRKQFRSLAS